VNTTGPIRQVVDSATPTQKRYLVVAEGDGGKVGNVVQVQAR
jgi:hypothetical protein